MVVLLTTGSPLVWASYYEVVRRDASRSGTNLNRLRSRSSWLFVTLCTWRQNTLCNPPSFWLTYLSESLSLSFPACRTSLCLFLSLHAALLAPWSRFSHLPVRCIKIETNFQRFEHNSLQRMNLYFWGFTDLLLSLCFDGISKKTEECTSIGCFPKFLLGVWNFSLYKFSDFLEKRFCHRSLSCQFFFLPPVGLDKKSEL